MNLIKKSSPMQKFFPALLALAIALTSGVSNSYANSKQSFLSQSVVEKAQKSVVKIDVSIRKSAYGYTGAGTGTGFIVDKKRGLVATNAHISDRKRIEILELTFFNGREAKAKLIYSDPFVDFSFLKVDPETIPENVTEVKFSAKPVLNDTSVFMVGSNEGQAFSVQDGVITSIYDQSDYMTYQTMLVTLNNRGGSSGSPIFDKNGEVVGIIFGGSDTYATAIYPKYLTKALEDLQDSKIPARYDCGLHIEYEALDKVARFSSFPSEELNQYLKKFPDSRNLVLKVSSTLEDSSADKVIESGDVIWKVNGTLIGPRLYEMQKIINNSPKKVTLEVYRHGKLINFEIETYPLDNHTIKRMVELSGAMFYEVDYRIATLTGAKLGTVFMGNVNSASSFATLPHFYNVDTSIFQNPIYLLSIESIAGHKIANLDDLVGAIPDLEKKKDFVLKYTTFGSYRTFGGGPYLAHRQEASYIKYDNYIGRPTLFEYNSDAQEWDVKEVVGEQGKNPDVFTRERKQGEKPNPDTVGDKGGQKKEL